MGCLAKFGLGTVFAAGLLLAQQQRPYEFELSGDIGYGLYHNGTIFSSSGTAQAGIRNRFAAGINFSDEFSPYVSAELQYLYHDGHPFLQAPGVRSDIQGNSHALTYSLLFHFQRTERRLRPFLEAGAGAKGYIIAGPEPNPQAVPQIASLTDNDVWKVAFVVGWGVKYALRQHMQVRLEFRDYLTTFPRQQIVPAAGNTARGIAEQFTPLFSVAYTFGPKL